MTTTPLPMAIDELPDDPEEVAEAIGLRYVSDAEPGIRRQRSGADWEYLSRNGRRITNGRTLMRIKQLAIPPAWTDVWICSAPNGHIQATGRDAKGRKQYRYHPLWRQVRDETKYHRMVTFGQALPRIRAQVDHDLGLPGLPRPKVVATVVRLLEETLIRVGNEEYARQNESYGLTTMRTEHVEVAGSLVQFSFKGKANKYHTVDVRDRRVARIVARCMDLPGQELFQYVDDKGDTLSVESADVNAYLRGVTGEDLTAKDFRTWHGTVLALQSLRAMDPFTSPTGAKRNINDAIKAVAARLGNTPAVCRKCYVHPEVLDAYLEQALANLPDGHSGPGELAGLTPEEADTLAFLQARMGQRPEALAAAATDAAPEGNPTHA